tara:strand:+ start:2852 stop:3265 length:414 start_codon:yes stop_codon:yes gene_type:complete
MDINDLRGTVLQRFQELTDEEKGIFDTIMDSPVGTVINKLVGPELDEIFSEPESETDRMLADDMPQRFGRRERDMPQDMPQTMKQDMPVEFEGRSQAGNTVPPLKRPQLENRKGERLRLRDDEPPIRDREMREMASR